MNRKLDNRVSMHCKEHCTMNTNFSTVTFVFQKIRKKIRSRAWTHGRLGKVATHYSNFNYFCFFFCLFLFIFNSLFSHFVFYSFFSSWFFFCFLCYLIFFHFLLPFVFLFPFLFRFFFFFVKPHNITLTPLNFNEKNLLII